MEPLRQREAIQVGLMVALAIISAGYFLFKDSFVPRAAAKAAVVSTIAWINIVLGVLKHTDPLIPAVFFVFVYCFLIAVGAGIPIWWYRNRKAPAVRGSAQGPPPTDESATVVQSGVGQTETLVALDQSEATTMDIGRVVSWAGLAGTVLLIVVGLAMALASSSPPSARILLGIAYAVIWMLSPYLGALIQRPGTPAERTVVLVARVLVVALGAYGYLSGWVFYEGPTRMTGRGMLAVVVPLYQWVILGIAFVVRLAVGRVGAR